MHFIGLIALLTSGLAPAIAADRQLDEQECLRRHPTLTSSVEMVTCTSDIRRSEQELSASLPALSAKVSPQLKVKLAKSQLAWIAYRDAECLSEAGEPEGNTAHSSAIIWCTADMNQARAKALKDTARRNL